MKRSDIRKEAVFCIYQHLLLDESVESIIENLEDVSDNKVTVEAYFNELVLATELHQINLINHIKQYLSANWQFERLSYLEQAILLVGTCEITVLSVAKSVVINEMVEMAKDYCDDKHYQFINAVLDQMQEN